MSKSDKIWYDDVRVLARRPLEFFPSKSHTVAEQTNALVRLALYVTVVLTAYTRSARVLWAGLGIAILVTLVYRGRGGRYAGLNVVMGSKPACRAPTRENPFANMLVSEYGKELPPPPCEYDDVKKETEEFFDAGLFKDIEDVYNVNNSQRQFSTVPNGGRPPDLNAFAQFLAKDMKGTCKQDSATCTGHFP